MTKMRFLYPLLSAVVASAVVVGLWIGTGALNNDDAGEVFTIRTTDFPYITSSLEDLSASADVVIVGRVSRVAAAGTDRGRDNDGAPIPYTAYEVEVQETWKGNVSGSIYVIRTDPSYYPSEPLTVLTVGETVLLYLGERSATLIPTFTLADTIYRPTVLDNGVFDVSLGAVGVVTESTVMVPRGISPDMFTAGTTFTTAEIRAAIEPEGEEGPTGNVGN